MKNLKYLLLFTLLPVFSCDDDNAEKTHLELDDFSIDVPGNWQHVALQGYDSKVAKFVTIRGEDITYDLGWYSDTLRADPNTHDIIHKTIDGKNAKIVNPKKSGQGTTGVYFADIGNGNRFQMSGLDLSANTQATLLSAIETLHFK
jgi:hypothetical protein